MADKTIFKKLIEIQSKLKAPKSQYNSFGKYSYRSCEDILEAVKPLLKAQNCVLTISDEVKVIGDRFYVEAITTLYDADSGEIITTSALAREDKEKKGMDGSQITGASSSYARKYALNGLFLIDDTKDADFSNQQPKEKKPDNRPVIEPPPPPAQKCMTCGRTIEAGGGMTSAEVATARMNKYGLALCNKCAEAKRNGGKN